MAVPDNKKWIVNKLYEEEEDLWFISFKNVKTEQEICLYGGEEDAKQYSVGDTVFANRFGYLCKPEELRD